MSETSKGPMMALVVEDDQNQADLVGALLEEADFQVVEVASGEEALACLHDHAHDIALLYADLRLGRSIDGIDLARAVSINWPWIRLIVTSGDPEEDFDQLPETARFMRKPWRALDLLVEAERISPS